MEIDKGNRTLYVLLAVGRDKYRHFEQVTEKGYVVLSVRDLRKMLAHAKEVSKETYNGSVKGGSHTTFYLLIKRDQELRSKRTGAYQVDVVGACLRSKVYPA